MSSKYDLVRQFHNKFGLEYTGLPRKLPNDEQKFRITCLREELREYEDAVEIDDLEGELDALVDLVYFALGTAHRNGWDFDTAFNRVHYANMQKEIDTRYQRRGYHLEVTKPAGWIPPNLSSLVMPNRSPLNSEEVQEANLCGLITIDGPDSSGKTTLAKRIIEMTKGEYIHLTWSPELEKVMTDYRTGAITYAVALAKEKVVVLERPVVSHLVYSNVYRNGELVDDAIINNWLGLLKPSCVNILALPSSMKHWFDLYVEMTTTREELYAGANNDLMKEVFKNFKHYTYALGMEHKQYDMFAVAEPVDIDNWIAHNVFSKLNKREN